MKFLIFIYALLLTTICWMGEGFSQGFTSYERPVGFGDGFQVKPHPSAMLEMQSTNKGFLPPRLTTAQRDALIGIHGSLPVGLQIYNSDEASIQVWNGAGWIGFLGGIVGFGEENCIALWAADGVPELVSAIVCIDGNVVEVIDTDNPLAETPMILRGQNDAGILIEELAKVTGRLEVESTTVASRPCPLMTNAQRDAITGAALGDCITNTDLEALEVFDGTSWGAVGGGGLDPWESEFDSYEIGDVIYVEFEDEDRIFVATTAHTSSVNFATDIANWDLLADASVTVLDGVATINQLRIGTNFGFTGGIEVDDIINDMDSHTATSLATSSSIDTAIGAAADEKLDKIAESIDNEVVLWDGITGDAVKGSGVLIEDVATFVMFTEQTVAAEGEINSSIDTSQFRPVKSASGLETASTTPFGNKAFKDGIEITVMGTSSTDTLRLVPSDEAGGCVMNGAITLTRFTTITFKWVNELERFVELRRNGL